MDVLYIIIAVIALVSGVVLIFAPRTLIQVGEVFNLIRAKAYIQEKRGIFGWVFILLGVVLLVLAR